MGIVAKNFDILTISVLHNYLVVQQIVFRLVFT